MARADLSRHHCPAFPAEEPRRQKIIVLASVHGGRFFVVRDPLLYTVESFFVDDRGHRVGKYNIPEFIFADIFSNGQNTVKKIIADWIFAVGDASCGEQGNEFFRFLAVKKERMNPAENARKIFRSKNSRSRYFEVHRNNKKPTIFRRFSIVF